MLTLTNLAAFLPSNLKKWLKSLPIVEDALHKRWIRNTYATYYIHEIMLSDAVRVNNYHRAIQKYVNEGDVVVDIGTGTGLLALFACQKNPAKVYAIDLSDMLETAKLMAKQNQYHQIEFLKIHSREFNPPEKVNVILHELMGHYLFEEKFIDSLTYLRDKVLAKGGKIIPSKFDFFIEPMTLNDEYRIPYIWQMDLHGIRYDGLKDSDDEWQHFHKDGIISEYIQQQVLPYQVKQFLCEPEKLFSIDLETMARDDVPKTLHYTKTVTHDGRLDVLGIYWQVNFDNEIYFDTSPLSPRTHWETMCIRLEGEALQKGDTIELDWTFKDISMLESWKLRYQIHKQQP